ncbi:putative retrotransposon protein [Tanacetum coccineum]
MGYSFYYPPENKVLVAQNAEFLDNSLITQEASGSLDDLEIIQEEDTHPSIDTSLHHDEDDQQIDEPQSEIIPIRRSTRTRHAPVRMCLYVDTEEHELGDLNEPANYKATLLDPESDKWLAAMNVEIFGKWMSKLHSSMDISLKRSIWCNLKVLLIQNIQTKYYGLKQASRQWNKRFDDEIKKFGFTQSRDEPCVYKKANGSNVTFLILFHMENSKRESIPMQDKLKLCKSQGASTPAEVKRMQNIPYALAGTAVKNILKYLWNTKDMFLVYGGDIKRELKKSTKQGILATSSAKGEYIAVVDASKDAVWVRKFISGLGVVPTNKVPMKMYCYNTRPITIANEPGITKGARHYRIKVHYLHKVIELGDIVLEKIHTDDNVADLLPKALPFNKRFEHTRSIEDDGAMPECKTVRIFLRSIGKASHLKDIPPTDETKDQWLQNDARLFLMIMNSIEPSVIPLLDHCEYAFHRGEQQDLSLTAYVMEFKKMYEELNSILPISADSPHSSASNSALVSRGGSQGGYRNGNNDRVGDSQGFNSDEVECYYCHELGHTRRNCKKLLAKSKGSSARASATSDNTVTISFEEYARLKGPGNVNSSTSTAATAIAGTKSVEVAPYFSELRPVLQVAPYFSELRPVLQVALYFSVLRPVLLQAAPYFGELRHLGCFVF